ncbi:MAG: hypothetical protein K2X87_11305 [Gemmataceae bacterium]|nr:hypothetical protein [Gemmataceae bacterium]
MRARRSAGPDATKARLSVTEVEDRNAPGSLLALLNPLADLLPPTYAPSPTIPVSASSVVVVLGPERPAPTPAVEFHGPTATGPVPFGGVAVAQPAQPHDPLADDLLWSPAATPAAVYLGNPTPATTEGDRPVGVDATPPPGGPAPKLPSLDGGGVPITDRAGSGGAALLPDNGSGDGTVHATSGGTVSFTVGDRVWADYDGEGDQDAGEPGLVGITVRLFNSSGIPVATAKTGANGAYSLPTTAAPGAQFHLKVDIPTGYSATLRYATTADADSNINGGGFSDTLTVPAGGKTDNTVDAGLIPPAPRVVITNAGGAEVGAEGLKVAKWQDAFEPTADKTAVLIKGPNPTMDGTKNWDFIDRDPDRFSVWVFDKPAWDNNTAHVEAKISTTNVAGFTMYDDNATPVDLVRYAGAAKSETGWYWSDSQMLVSNLIDDTYSAAAYLQSDNQPTGGDGLPKNGDRVWKVSDRTHQVALRGTVKAEYTAGTKTVAATKPVPAAYRVKITATALNETVGGAPVIDVSAADQAIHTANEHLAQVGLYVVPTHDRADPPQPGVNLGNGLQGYNDKTAPPISLTAEETALFTEPKLTTAATDDIELFWVNFINTPDRQGYAFWASAVPHAKYADHVGISTRTRVYNTIAHEIGHVLLDDGFHYTGPLAPANLMNAVAGWVGDSVTAPRRLTVEQETDMLCIRYNLLSPP